MSLLVYPKLHTYIYCFVAAISWIITDTQINNQTKEGHSHIQHTCSFPTPNLNTFGSFVFELYCADKQTNRRSQTIIVGVVIIEIYQ